MLQGSDAPAPFTCHYTPSFPEILCDLQCSIAFSTYQAGKVVILSAVNHEKIAQLPRTFANAMALGISGDRLAVATQNTVVVLANAPTLAPRYPKQPDTYDSFFAPRATYYTGHVDIHGLEWGNEGLWAIVTSFSCLANVTDAFSFEPKWKPPFITELVSEDRCHLNGLAMKDGEPRWVTALSGANTDRSWRKTIPGGGLLLSVPDSAIVLDDLAMPHSPRVVGDEIFLLLSATGEVVRVEADRSRMEVVNRINGFVRGLSVYGDHLFVGRSRLRQSSSTFRDLPIAKRTLTSGISVIHRQTGAIVAELHYAASVDEIFDVQIIPNFIRPGILNTDDDTLELSLTTPTATYWASKGSKKES